MKKIVFCLLILSCSCSLTVLDLFNPDIYPFPNYYILVPELTDKLTKYDSTIIKVAIIAQFVDFTIIAKDLNYEKTPKEIMKTKTGNCKHHATLFAWLVYQELKIKPLIIRSKNNKKYHRYVYIKELNYTYNKLKDFKDYKTYTFDYYMKYIDYLILINYKYK